MCQVEEEQNKKFSEKFHRNVIDILFWGKFLN